MAHYGYGWYTQEQLEEYYDQLIGSFFITLNLSNMILLIINNLSKVSMPRL